MGLKIITTLKSDIEILSEKRFDVKYYFVNSFLDKLEDKSICKVKTLSELNAKISSGSYVDTYIDKSEGVPYLRVGNIKPFSIDEQDNSLVFVSSEVPSRIKTKENDIILGRTQATFEKLGVASIVDKTNENSVISQHLSKISIVTNEISPYYLIAYLNSRFYKAQTALATHGDTRVEMTHSQLKQLRIFIPSNSVVESIEKKVKKIIKNNRISINNIRFAQKFLKKKLNIKSNSKETFFTVNLETIKNFGIWNGKSHLPKLTGIEEEIKCNFRTIRLGDISKIKKGVEVGSKNYKTELFKQTHDLAFIRTSDITNNEIDVYPDYFVSKDIAKILNNVTTSGDILFSKDGIIGETTIVLKYDKVVIASGFAKIKLKPEAAENGITSEYLFAVLSLKETGYYPAIRRTVIASTIPHLRQARLEEIEIPILDEHSIIEITKFIKKAFELKNQKKKLTKEVIGEIDSYFDI